MSRTNARILLLASVLVSWMYPLKAQKAFNFGSGASQKISFKPIEIGGPSGSPVEVNLPSAIELKGTRPRPKDFAIPSSSKPIDSGSNTLKPAPDLALPDDSSQVRITELRPLSLAEVEELVQANNPTLKVAAIQVQQAKDLLVAAIASWYPTLSLTANGLPQYLKADTYTNPDFATNNEAYSKSSQWRSTISAQVKWNLINPKRVPQIASARDTYEKAKYTYIIALRDLQLKAVNQYFNLQRADEGVRIGKQSIKASLLSLKDAESRFKAGVATKLEVLEAETQLARDKQLYTRKLGDQKISRRILAGMLNLPENITPTASSSPQILGLWQPTLQESIVAAYQFREELDQLLLDISINNSAANMSLADIQPILSLVNTFSYTKYQGQQGVASSDSIDMDDHGWSASNTIGLNASWNIFDGGRARANYNYSKNKVEEVKAKFAEKREVIRTEVERSFINLQTSNQEILSTAREVLASRESLRLARLRYQAGISTQREVVNNQRDLTRAEVGYTDAMASYNISLSELRRRTGLDSISPCKSLKISSTHQESSDLNEVPIEPIPVKPACEAPETVDEK